MNAVDTNIWIYSHDTRLADKQLVAQQTIAGAPPFALPWQVGCEFIAASRKLEPFGFTKEEAWAALADMQTIASAILLPEPLLWSETKALQERHSLSFWDALLTAACIRAEVKTLYTENIG